MNQSPAEQIEGLFEIHITVDPDQIDLLRLFCLDQKLKPILAVASIGKNPNQLMISKFKRGTFKEIIQRMDQLQKEMEDFGLKIVRKKIESMAHNKGVPQRINLHFEGKEYYFEFHLKYAIENSKQYREIEKIAIENDCGVSFSAFKENIKALFTIRIAGFCGFENAEKQKNKIIDKLKEKGFHTHDQIQQEFSVFDSNPEYDDGWLKTIIAE